MNVGFFIAGYVFDYVRQTLGEPHGKWLLPVVGIELSTYQTLFLVSLIVVPVLPEANLLRSAGQLNDVHPTADAVHDDEHRRVAELLVDALAVIMQNELVNPFER